MATEPIGVLLMAYGSPDRLEDVEPYFTDIRGGRPPAPEFLEELKSRYQRVGLPTPLLAVSEQLARELEKELNRQDDRFAVALGMKHWQPRIGTALEELSTRGVERAVGLVLAPHYSRISIGGYRERVEAATGRMARPINVDLVESWHLLDGYLDALAENVREESRKFVKPGGVTVVFTAHSLPARIMNEDDPYLDQLLATSEEVARRAGITNWRFSFQSQSQTGEPWLGPDLLDTLKRLKELGQLKVLVAPVGFIADHLEILYDIDIEAAERAGELGLELRRIEMLNADPRLVRALSGLVLDRLAVSAGRPAGPV
jgi:ferrochelatase